MAPSGGLDKDDADICEDPRLPDGERVKVLELGDGRSSRFSNHGVASRDKFRSEYCLGAHYLRLDVLMGNKQLTHDRSRAALSAAGTPRRQRYALLARACRGSTDQMQRVVRDFLPEGYSSQQVMDRLLDHVTSDPALSGLAEARCAILVSQVHERLTQGCDEELQLLFLFSHLRPLIQSR
uniref:Replication factor C C-terminal domain-containing protein n=1 Tax=Alexandrium monilatum TaxID=311494 RepID=A0A7S4Q751_9DINO